MKKIITILLCLPILSFTTKDPASPKTKHLSTITSDTVHGSFYQIKIKYDSLQRVVSIHQTKNLVSAKISGNSIQTITHLINTQNFEYAGNNLFPAIRRRAIYRYDKAKRKDIITDCQVQYFKYTDGKRVGDSIYNSYVLKSFYKDGEVKRDTILHNEIAEADSGISHESVYNITSTDIFRKHEEGRMYNPPTITTDYLTYGLNVIKADYEVHQFNNDVFGYYFTFEKFDQSINPLKSLNIAPYISSEIFDFVSADSDPEGFPINKWNPPCLPTNYLGWSYVNDNNPISYTKNGSGGDTRHECPLKNYITINYAYNSFNLPLRCTVTIKTINLRMPDNGKNIKGIEKRHFNFLYKD